MDNQYSTNTLNIFHQRNLFDMLLVFFLFVKISLVRRFISIFMNLYQISFMSQFVACQLGPQLRPNAICDFIQISVNVIKTIVN